MFFVKKLVSPFLLPPGIFIVLLLGLATLLWRKRRRGTALLNFLLGILLWSVASAPVADRLLQGLEKGLTIPRPLQGDVIVLLGGGINDEVPDLTGKGAPTDEMLGRVVTAVRAQRELKVPIIVSGGTVFAGMSAEAPVVRRFLIDLGVPEQQILVEIKSRDTMENARYCRQMADQYGFRRPLLVTTAYHMRRSLMAFKRAGMPVTPLPAQFSTAPGRPRIWTDYLPSAGSLHASAKAIHEYLGMLFYRFGG